MMMLWMVDEDDFDDDGVLLCLCEVCVMKLMYV